MSDQVEPAAESAGEPVIIVGGGQAAVQLCLALRKEKVSSPVLMLSEESEYPYHRPPLSKSFLSGETDLEKLTMRPASFYQSKDVQVELNAQVTEIDPGNKTVTTNKATHNFQSLVIATGARPRPLPVPGAELAGVHLLRDIEHSIKIKSELASAANVVVIGAGFIGLEFAAVANAMKKRVTVFDTADRVMARAVSPDVSVWFEKTHSANGIAIRLNDSVAAIEGDSAVQRIITADGKKMDCDLLVIGIGVVPNSELADNANITCDNGIVVNEFCETSAPDIYAVGDVASHPNPFSGSKMVRLESVQNATDQARVVASVISGNKKPYESVPWFWSDQGEHSLQMTGLSDNADQFVRRDPKPADNAASPESFSVFHYRAGILQSVDSVNSPRDHMLARKLIANNVSPTPEQAADPDFELKSLLS